MLLALFAWQALGQAPSASDALRQQVAGARRLRQQQRALELEVERKELCAFRLSCWAFGDWLSGLAVMGTAAANPTE